MVPPCKAAATPPINEPTLRGWEAGASARHRTVKPDEVDGVLYRVTR